MSEYVLQTEHLHKNFGGVSAVRDFSFHISEGQVVAIIGPNGNVPVVSVIASGPCYTINTAEELDLFSAYKCYIMR